MIFSRHPKHLSSGWTIFEVFFIMLAASVAAYLVSSFFSSNWRGVVFSFCFVAFGFGFWFWLLVFVLSVPSPCDCSPPKEQTR
jgi:hypothetical protein